MKTAKTAKTSAHFPSTAITPSPMSQRVLKRCFIKFLSNFVTFGDAEHKDCINAFTI